MSARPKRKVTDRLLDEFLRLKCAPEVLAAEVFPNAKELSESMGAFESLRRGLIAIDRGDLFSDPDVILYDVGSGRQPRTATLAAFRSRWTCVAIDPILNHETGRWKRVRRLRTEPKKVEDYVVPDDEAKRFAVVLAVHNHAKLSATIEALRLDERPGYCLISMPCCFDHDVDVEWDEIYDDYGIKSPDRTVYRKLVLV